MYTCAQPDYGLEKYAEVNQTPSNSNLVANPGHSAVVETQQVV